MRRTILHSLLLAGLGVSLGACSGDMGKVLGIDKAPPDEFRVVSRAPLSIPPEFGLRPPEPGAQRPQEPSPTQEAETALLGREARQRQAQQLTEERSGKSPGEVALLERADAFGIERDIRRVVNEESAVLASADDGFIDTLLFWRDKEQPGTVVDANQEARRLRENQSLGRSTTEGDTPMIRRKADEPTFRWPF